MIALLTLGWTLLAAAPAAGAACSPSGLVDYTLVAAADVAFAGRVVRADPRSGRVVYRVVRPLAGKVRRGQQLTVTPACGLVPDGAEHLVLLDAGRAPLGGREGIQATRPARLEALAAFVAVAGEAARARWLAERYAAPGDAQALAALVDDPALVRALGAAEREALVRAIGRAPWGRYEAAALARLGGPMAIGLLSLADARCEDRAFDTPCARAIPAALAVARGAAGADAAAWAACLRGEGGCSAPVVRLRALAACEEARGRRWEGGAGLPRGWAGRVEAEPALLAAALAGAAAWCEAGEP